MCQIVLCYVVLCHVELCNIMLCHVVLPRGPVAVHVDVQRNERAGRGRAVEYQTRNLLRKKFL